jgi:hypothetical protein
MSVPTRNVEFKGNSALERGQSQGKCWYLFRCQQTLSILRLDLNLLSYQTSEIQLFVKILTNHNCMQNWEHIKFRICLQSRTHTHTNSVGLLLMSGQLIAEAAICKTQKVDDKLNPCPQLEWNSRSQQSSSCTLQITRPHQFGNFVPYRKQYLPDCTVVSMT